MHWSTFDNISGALLGLKVRFCLFDFVKLTLKLERAVEKQMLAYNEVSLTPASLLIYEFDDLARTFSAMAR